MVCWLCIVKEKNTYVIYERKLQGPKSNILSQEGRVMKIVIALVLIALLWVVFTPGSGIVTLIKKRSELHRLQKEKVQLEQQIDALQEDIDRLHSDPAYLEDVARRKVWASEKK